MDKNDKRRVIIRALSDRIVDAQQPIRILDAIKWDDSVKQAFFSGNCQKPPQVDAAYYKKIPLGFDTDVVRQEFKNIDQDISAQLGDDDTLGMIMRRMCREYLLVVDMLEARGTPEFSQISQQLYGCSTDVFHERGPSLSDLGELLDESLRNIDESMFLEKAPRDIPTQKAVVILQDWLNRIFNDKEWPVHVIESDGIIADAAAGSDYIKLRSQAYFSERDLRCLEAHEGWVHVGTTINGHLQPVCTFLSKGAPSATITQEGIATFVEIISFNSHPARLRRIADRIRAIHLAEHGASFMDIFTLFCDEGRSREESYTAVVRVFRGSLPDGGPFAKDLAYSKGFIRVYNFIRLAVRRGQLDRIPLLFCGKLAIEDMGVITGLANEGLITRPRYLPPPLVDINALTAWMMYSNFLNRLDLFQVDAENYRK